MPRALPLLVLAAHVFFAAASARAQDQEQDRYRVTDLGSLGGTALRGVALNDAGDVAGWALVTPAGGGSQVRHPVLYSDGKLTDIGLVPRAVEGRATAINSAGHAAVTYTFRDGTPHAFRYANGVLTELGVPAGFTGTLATGINDSGVIAGTASGSATGIDRPFVFADGAFKTLDLPAGASRSRGDGLNIRGQVLGYYRTENGPNGMPVNHYALWTDGRWAEVNVPAGYQQVHTTALNNLGQVAGEAIRNVDPNGNPIDLTRPLVYDESGGARALPYPFGGPGPFILGNNDHGDLVGFDGRGTVRPVLYSDGVWSMPGDALTLPPGYRLTSAVDINNAGQLLAIATGPNATTRTFLLTPVPEPGGMAVLPVAAVALLRPRRR